MRFQLFGQDFTFPSAPVTLQDNKELMLLKASMDKLNDIVMITQMCFPDEPHYKIVYVNEAFEKHTGYSRQEVMGRSPRLLQGQGSQYAELGRIRTALSQLKPIHAELINYKKDGSLFWIEMDIVPIQAAGGAVSHWVSTARDITQRKTAEEEIEYLAFHDPLTQLPNRQLLMDRLERVLAQGTDADADAVEAGGINGALMFIDLDNFKVLNDTLGHATGDELLRKVATRLGSCVRLNDTVARLGGDEFVVMLESLPKDAAAAVDYSHIVGQRILLALSDPYDLAGYQHYSTCSIGITLFDRREQSMSDLLKQADLAMYQAKASGRNTVCFFDPSLQASVIADAALNTELRQSLRAGDFVLYYQPQVGREGRMFGVEALVRWQHPARGLIFPDAFITQAEESGLILQLGQWVIETACVQLAKWAKHTQTSHLRIAVNVSVQQFRHPDFVDMVMATIKRVGINANKLELELTESLLATGMEVTIAKMGLLKNAGITLSIDDFGIGYSALSYLKHLPLDQLKIDRLFVKDILSDPNDAAIARTIIGLAQSLGLRVVAEGVETIEQRDMLRRFGCDSYQGHLFCPALHIDALQLFMQQLPA